MEEALKAEDLKTEESLDLDRGSSMEKPKDAMKASSNARVWVAGGPVVRLPQVSPAGKCRGVISGVFFAKIQVWPRHDRYSP